MPDDSEERRRFSSIVEGARNSLNREFFLNGIEERI